MLLIIVMMSLLLKVVLFLTATRQALAHLVPADDVHAKGSVPPLPSNLHNLHDS